MREDQLKEKLPVGWQDLEIKSFSKLPSTNDWTKKYLKENDTEVLVVAKEQTAGRGRSGRSFYSELDEGLYFSLGVKTPNISPTDLPLYTIATASAMMQAVEEELSLELEVKWVNDLFYHGRKVAGILTEGLTDPKTNTIDSLVIGLGLNLVGSFSKLDKKIETTAGTLYEDLPKNFSVENLLASFLKYFLSYHRNLTEKAFIPVYEEKLLGIQEDIYYIRKNRKYYAKIKGISHEGKLMIRNQENKIEELAAGEIHFSSQQFAKD